MLALFISTNQAQGPGDEVGSKPKPTRLAQSRVLTFLFLLVAACLAKSFGVTFTTVIRVPRSLGRGSNNTFLDVNSCNREADYCSRQLDTGF